jgi:NADPH:quinone reductase-like Zn-dependent oxidoreductase
VTRPESSTPAAQASTMPGIGERVWVFGGQSYRPFGDSRATDRGARCTWGGATVIGTVLLAADLAYVDRSAVPHVVVLGQGDPAAGIREHAPSGVDRIVEVALSDNGELDASVVANDAVIATYFSRSDRIDLPFSPLLFANVTLRLLGSDDFSFQAKQHAAHDLTAAAAAGALSVRVGAVFPPWKSRARPRPRRRWGRRTRPRPYP